MTTTKITPMKNPFVHELLDSESLPRYDLIQADQVLPAMDQLLSEARSALSHVTSETVAPSWDAVMVPLSEATERLSRAWSAVHHMSGVMDSPEWREATNSRLAEVSAFWTELSQHPQLFEKVKAIHAQGGLNPARQRAIENSLRAFRLGGAGC
jgi:oligopeptidase A